MNYLPNSDTTNQQSERPSTATILCYRCGASIAPNALNLCVGCVSAEVDIGEEIARHSTLSCCPKCRKYLVPPSAWVAADWESKEQLALCLKRLRGLARVKVCDAGFLYSEEHSKRLRIRLQIEKEVNDGAVVKQELVVEVQILSHICEKCQRFEAKDYWRAVVQVRQKTAHKKTFYLLEQLILKANAHSQTINIKEQSHGVDFYFANKADARKLVDFVLAAIPARYQTSQNLVSHDPKSNVYHYKTTFSVEIASLCRNDVVCLPKAIASSLGFASSRLVCVARIATTIRLVDPTSGKQAELFGAEYFKRPFHALVGERQLTRFIVIDVERSTSSDAVADVWVERSGELGTGTEMCARTHLAHLLAPGDQVLGFDTERTVVNDADFDALKSDSVPDVILVKKVYEQTDKRARRRRKRLLAKSTSESTAGSTLGDDDYQEFIAEIERDEKEDGGGKSSVETTVDHES